MDLPLGDQHWNVQQDCLSSTPLKKTTYNMDDQNGFANSSFVDSPKLGKPSRQSATSKDEFWDALSSDYHYLMDDGLIATCREASSDLSFDDENEIPESFCWSFTRFIEQFKELHDLLHCLQVEKEESGSKSNPAILEEQQHIAYSCKLFNEQAQKLSKRYPDMRDEVHRHLNLLNNKWEAVEHSINPSMGSPSKDGVFDEVTNRMRFLRKGLRDLENRLLSITEDNNWSLGGLEDKIKKQQILQKEIEAKGKYVSSLLKLCEHLHGNVRFGQSALSVWDAERVRRVVSNLQNRWHAIWLQSVECHCKLEELVKSFKTGNIDKLEKSFSEEPVKKHPRLSDSFENSLIDNGPNCMMSLKSEETLVNYTCPTDVSHQQNGCTNDSPGEVPPKNDKAVMVGATGITELKAECSGDIGKFEIVQDIGYSSETSVHYSTDEKLDASDPSGFNTSSTNPLYINQTSVQLSNGVSSEFKQPSQIYLSPDKYPSFSQKTWKSMLIADQNLHSLKYNTCKAVPDSFYKVTSVDELYEDVPETVVDGSSFQAQLITKEHPSPITAVVEQKKVPNYNKTVELINKLMPQSPNSHIITTKEKLPISHAVKPISLPNNSPSSTIHRKSKRGSKFSVQNASPKTDQHHENVKNEDRVVEWLKKCCSGDEFTSDDNFEPPEKIRSERLQKNIIDSSCDASGEYTSDSERSGISDDVNNSVSFSQSFTGSIETVVPVVLEELGMVHRERAGSAEPLPGVKWRKKKRGNRDRPWSVTDVRQTIPQPSVPHSTSESALEKLLSASSRKIPCTETLSLDNKRPSVTDVSSAICYNMNSESSDPCHHSMQGCEKTIYTSKRNSSFSGISSDNYEATLCVASKKSTASSLSGKKSAQECSKTFENEEAHTSGEELGKLELKTSSIEYGLISPERNNSVAATTTDGNTEDHGSMSDQAWDEYQDPPYLSEPYSEQTADEDELKKLTNFGEDYRAILGSYSDTSSICAGTPAKGQRRFRSRSSWKKSKSHENSIVHSDSDSEDFHDILATSHHALQFVSNSIKENTQKFSELSSEFDELVATCQTNLCNLHEIHEELLTGSEIETFSKEDINKLQALIKEWESLQVKLLSPAKHGEQKPSIAELEASENDISCSMDLLRQKLSGLESKASQNGAVSSLQSLDFAIQDLQSGLTNLQELKQPVFSLRAKTHRLKSSGGGPATALLHGDANKLYQQWESVYEIICSQLTKMQTLRSEWRQPTESAVEGETETAVLWKPVQVGGTLPKTEVSKQALHPLAAAEVQTADVRDVLMEIDTSLASIRCRITEDPVLCDNLPAPTKSLDEVHPPKRAALWRILRAAVPIHFVMVVLYCIACYMEPQCCENLNNYEFSMLPQLRYVRGPPPV